MGLCPTFVRMTHCPSWNNVKVEHKMPRLCWNFPHFVFISTIHQISKCSHLFSHNKNVSDLLICLLELVLCLYGCMSWQWTWLRNVKVLWSFCPCFLVFFLFFLFFNFFSIHHIPEAVFPVCCEIGQALWHIISTDFAALKLSFWHKNYLNFYEIL